MSPNDPFDLLLKPHPQIINNKTRAIFSLGGSFRTGVTPVTPIRQLNSMPKRTYFSKSFAEMVPTPFPYPHPLTPGAPMDDWTKSDRVVTHLPGECGEPR